MSTGHRWTVPNAICGLRIVALAPLAWTAHQGLRTPFLGLLVAVLVSDWLDGKLAKWLDQETVFGARLDSAADALMYGVLALSFWWLEGEAVRRLVPWLLAVAVTWGLSAAVALVRFRRMPSYHSWGAKGSWLAAGVAAVSWLLTGDPAVVPWALALVILTNLEAVAIGLALPAWRHNVATVVHALRLRRRQRRVDSGTREPFPQREPTEPGPGGRPC